jgi:opacity protein-like surface antigen
MAMSTLRRDIPDLTTLLVAPANISKTKVGWTAGVGAEWMFAHNWWAPASGVTITSTDGDGGRLDLIQGKVR